MNAPQSARDDARPLDLADRPIPDGDSAGTMPRPLAGPRPPDMAEIMPEVGRVVLGLTEGADLFLRRLCAQSPAFLPRARDGEDDRERTRQRYNSQERVDWQHRDSVEAARLANVLARLLERYRIGLHDLTEAKATPRPGQRP